MTINDFYCGDHGYPVSNKMVYAMLTTKCNLSCPYCDVKSDDDHWNQEKFMQTLHDFDGTILLFGGEPTLFRDRLKHVLYSDPIIREKVKSMTTNLMIMDEEMMQIMLDIGAIGTSWNPSRFRNGEYEKWISNLNDMNGRLPVMVIITMTFELLKMTPDEIMNIIRSWNPTNVYRIVFEHYVGPEVTPEYFAKCDELLCEIYKRWNVPIILKNEEMAVDYRCSFYCSRTNVLTPDGVLHPGCPQAQVNQRYTPTECLTCERIEKCKPCRLQPYCSYMGKFAELVNDRLSKGGEIYGRDRILHYKREHCGSSSKQG